MRRLAAVVLLIATVGVVVGCGASSGSRPSPAATQKAAALERTPVPKFAPATKEVANLKWNISEEEPETLDSAKAFLYGSVELLSNLCEPLEYLLPDGTREPALATSIEETNPTTYVVNVRHGVKFWDGNEMTAEDVAFSLNRIRDPKTASYYGGGAAEVKSITATGPFTVTIKMKEPEILYRELLVTPLGVVTEKKYVEEKGSTYGTAQGGVMCTGPYELKAWRSGSNIEIARNEDWWNAANRKQWPKAATFIWVNDPSTATTALDSGEIDGEFELPPVSVSTLQASAEGQLLVGPSANTLALTPLHTEGTIANVKIRQALAKLIDYEGFAKSQYAGIAVPARALVGPNAWVGAESVYRSAYEKLPVPEQNLEKAEKLIKESGVSNPKVTMATYSGYPQEAALASQIQASAKSIGFEVSFDNLPAPEYAQLYSSESAREKYDVMMQTVGPEIPEAFQLYQSVAAPGGINNMAGWSDPKVTKLIEEARRVPDPIERAKLTVQIQKIFTDQAVWIPVVFPQFPTFVNNRLAGVQASVTSVYYWPWLPEVGGR